MDSGRTTTRQYSEYSDFFSTQREREYDRNADLPQRESTQVRWGGRDGRRKPDSGLGHTQEYRMRWTDDDWVDPDSFTQKMEQPAGRKHRAGGRSAVNRIPEETVVHKDSRRDIPRKRALFTSDGPDSTTSGSDIPGSHADRHLEIEYSERLIPRRPQDKGGTEERLCSPNMELEMAVIRLQKYFDDCRTELELTRKHTPAVALRPPRRSGSRRRQFQDTPGNRIGNSTMRCLKPLYVRMVGTMPRRPCSCSLIWTEMHSTSLCWFRSLGEWYRDF